jgi:formylglycine-generating enzyme
MPHQRRDADASRDPPGMWWIGGGTFRMGADQGYPEEAPAHAVTVSAFWMDEHTVSLNGNATCAAGTP